MAEISITQTDIATLSKKIGELSDVLTEKEQNLLLAVFNLAGKAISSRLQQGESGGSQTERGSRRITGSPAAASLSQGFASAFESIGGNDFMVRTNLEKVAGGVGIGVVW